MCYSSIVIGLIWRVKRKVTKIFKRKIFFFCSIIFLFCRFRSWRHSLHTYLFRYSVCCQCSSWLTLTLYFKVKLTDLDTWRQVDGKDFFSDGSPFCFMPPLWRATRRERRQSTHAYRALAVAWQVKTHHDGSLSKVWRQEIVLVFGIAGTHRVWVQGLGY